jgi:hypothetical protein
MSTETSTFWERAYVIDTTWLAERLLRLVPATLTWTTLVGLTVLAFYRPLWVAIFIILYDIYWLVRAFYMAIYLIAAYRLLRLHRGIDWMARLRGLENIPLTIARVKREIARLQKLPAASRKERKQIQRQLWQTRQYLAVLRHWEDAEENLPDWKSILHVVIFPTANESFSVLRDSLNALRASTFPLRQMWVVVAFEERAGEHALRVRKQVEQAYRHVFGRLITTLHPDGILGEKKVKSANATWAIQQVRQLLDKEGIPYERVVVSNFDADTCVSRDYFAYLTFAYVTEPKRTRRSYQPLPLYHNNIWQAPSFARVIATNSSFWQMIESLRPERMVTFSSHSMSMRALVDVGYWQKDIVSEDSRIFWQCYLRYDGDYATMPLYTNVYMDAIQAGSFWRSFVAQYKQKRRWAWGIENFPYLALSFWRNKRIPWRKKLRHLGIMLEGHHSWATSPLIIAFIGWIPIFWGTPSFHATVLSFSFPYITRTLMTIAMVGLIASALISLVLLPRRPVNKPRWAFWGMIAQWALVPIIASILGAIPAVDAQTRLALGRDLGFWVSTKTRAGKAGREATQK